MGFIIRKATEADAADMANIHMRSWEAAYSGIIPDDFIKEKNAGRPAMWQKIMSGENDRYYILKLNDISVGIMTVAKPQDDKLGDTFYEVHGIYLHPDYYGKGYGTLAMDFAINFAKSLGKMVMVVCVLEDNFNARKFYEKCGFTYDGTKNEVTYGKPLNVIRYRMDI